MKAISILISFQQLTCASLGFMAVAAINSKF